MDSATEARVPDPRRWKALALLCVASFMELIDASIIFTALPSIERELGFSHGDVQWVSSAYLLTFGGLLLLGGRLADIMGRRRIFMVGTALFGLASLLCGFAWAAPVLVVARVLQGVAAAIMAPTALSILVTTFDEGPERNKALGIWSSTAGFGATAGLLLGGPITQWLGWEWLFFINVPVALALVLLSRVMLRESRASEHKLGFDIAGAATITLALLAGIYAIVQAPEAGWHSAETVGGLVVFAVLVALFVLIERRARAPIAPLWIFRKRSVIGGNIILLLLGMLAFGVTLPLTMYAQEVIGMSALQYGFGAMAMTAMVVVGASSAQALVSKSGFWPVAAAGMVLLGLGSLLLTQIRVDGSYFGDLFIGLLVFGPGIGCCFVSGSAFALSGVSERESGLASGLSSASFQIGGAIGIAIVSTASVTNAVGSDARSALNEGLRAAFTVCVVVAAVGLVLAILLLRRRGTAGAQAPPALSVSAGNDMQ